MLTLSIQNLSVHFSGNHVINDVSATLHGGEMVAVVGRNGVGKTTLIKAIARLIKRSGDVALYDDKGNLFSDRDIAYVPQLESVTSRLTAFEMVLLGLVKDLRWKVTDEQIEKVADTLAELGLDSLSRKPVCSLSGGQKQLVFMAQAFVSRPKGLAAGRTHEPSGCGGAQHGRRLSQAQAGLYPRLPRPRLSGRMRGSYTGLEPEQHGAAGRKLQLLAAEL